MRTVAIENEIANVHDEVPRGGVVANYAALVKARLTFLVLITTAVGYYLGKNGPFDLGGFLHVMLGTTFSAGGAAALNQWWERRADALMNRTKTRPIPTGRIRPGAALIQGSLWSVFGVFYLFIACNALSAILAGLTIGLYIFAYTPLKKISTANTLVGAVAGAIPPMIGWAAARGELGAGAWSLFAILFLWQMPHFFALAWMYRQDYARAGFRMMSNDDETGVRCASQSVVFCMLLLIVAGLPGYVGVTNPIYIPIAFALGGWFIAMAMKFHRQKTARDARALFLTSIVYLPLLLTALVLTKI